MKKRIFLGTGVLTWNATERRTDRYGSVYLIPEGQNSFSKGPSPSLIDEAAAKGLEGFAGDLIAVVKQNRESTHIGDLFRGVSPRTPDVGAEIVLGKNGKFFTQRSYDGGVDVGLRPRRERNNDWLDIRALYDAHEQSVDLFFQPKGKS